jgi:hypothetical protein
LPSRNNCASHRTFLMAPSLLMRFYTDQLLGSIATLVTVRSCVLFLWL